MYGMSYKDFGPRIGFAYNPPGLRQTVFSGSAGIIYDRTVIDAISFLQDQISYLFFNQQVNQFGSNSVRASLATNPRLGANLAYPRRSTPSGSRHCPLHSVRG